MDRQVWVNEIPKGFPGLWKACLSSREIIPKSSVVVLFVIPAPGKLRKEDGCRFDLSVFKVILGYRVRPYSKKREREKRRKECEEAPLEAGHAVILIRCDQGYCLDGWQKKPVQNNP